MVQAKRDASVLSVDGTRVAQSFSRGEVWLLKQVLTNVHNQPRLRELVDDSCYAKLLQKAQRMLAEADRKAEALPKQRQRGQQTRRIREAYAACVRAGREWSSGKFATDNGIPYRSVVDATRALRPARLRTKQGAEYDGEEREAAE